MMNEELFTFEVSPWEAALDTVKPGSQMTVGRFLTLLEGEPDEAIQQAFEDLEERRIALVPGDLPEPEAGEALSRRLELEKKLALNRDMAEGLEENDPLRLYLEEVAAIPVCGDPEVLALEAADGNENARTKLADALLSLVIGQARTCTGYGVLLMDLIQEGSMGLWQAILREKPEHFEDKARWWICQYMARQIAEQARSGGAGAKMRRAMEKYRAADEKLLTELGRNPTMEEIAQEIQMSMEETEYVSKMLTDARLLARAAAETQPRPEEEEDQAVEDTAYFQSRQRVEEMLSGLEELDSRILTCLFGLDGKLPLSPEETGSRLGLTAEEVVRREAAALASLRQSR